MTYSSFFPKKKILKRDTSNDPVQKYFLDPQVFDQVNKHFEKLFKKKYGFLPVANNRDPFIKKFNSMLSKIASDFYPEHVTKWRALSDPAPKEVCQPLIEERAKIGCEFIDWLFKNHFSEINFGCLTSPHWWTAYGQELAKKRVLEVNPTKSWKKPVADDDDEAKRILDSWK